MAARWIFDEFWADKNGFSADVLPSVAAALRSLNPKFASITPWTMREILLSSLGAQRYTLTLIAGFGVVALILAAVGVYGMMSYAVSQMTKEVGIRLSLGAQKQDIVRLVLRLGLWVVGLGTLLGLPCAAIGTRLIRSELYEVHPLNPLVLLSVAALLGFVTLLACYLPARRAARVDPMQALHYE